MQPIDGDPSWPEIFKENAFVPGNGGRFQQNVIKNLRWDHPQIRNVFGAQGFVHSRVTANNGTTQQQHSRHILYILL